MKRTLGFIALLLMLLSACIGDDFVDDRVDPVIRISNPIDSMAIDSSYAFKVLYLNNVGVEVEIEAEWSSSDETIITITSQGVAKALAPGAAEISVEYSDGEVSVMDMMIVGVGERTVETESSGKKGQVNTTSSYELSGAFTMESDDSGSVILSFGEDYVASTALPGLFVYLSNNPNSTSGALEIQAVEVFEGAHSYSVPNVGLNDYGYVLYFCKPFNVKVGDGKIED
jgi:hypothetical protein